MNKENKNDELLNSEQNSNEEKKFQESVKKIKLYERGNLETPKYEKYIRFSNTNIGGTMFGPFDVKYTVYEISDDKVNWEKLEKPQPYIWFFVKRKDAIDFYSLLDPDTAQDFNDLHLNMHKHNKDYYKENEQEILEYENRIAKNGPQSVRSNGKFYVKDMRQQNGNIWSIDN